MDADVHRALSVSHLRGVPPGVLAELMAGAVRARVPAGSVTHREGDGARHLDLVVSGVLRAFVTAPDGRTMTIRYCRSGALIGVMSLFVDRFTLPVTVQALVDADVLRLSPSAARAAADRDVRAARAFLADQSERALNFVYEIPGNAFATMRQRVVRHLLDLASERASGGASGPELAVPVSQRELAEAAGTVREVVVRVLRELRRDGLVRTERDRIVLVDPDRLTRELVWNRRS